MPRASTTSRLGGWVAPLVAFLVASLSACSDPGVPLADAVPAEFRAWAEQRADPDSWVSEGHWPFSIQVTRVDEERDLHGPREAQNLAKRLSPSQAELQIALRGWQPGLEILAAHYRVLALPPEGYTRGDWETLRLSPPLVEGKLEPGPGGDFLAHIALPCDPARGAQEFLVCSLVESEAGLFYLGRMLATVGPAE